MAHKKLKRIPGGKVKIASKFTRDVKQALRVGKKILGNKKKSKLRKFKVPDIKLTRNYGKSTPGIN